EEAEVTYYEPSACPPKAGTTYSRHETLVFPGDFPAKEDILKAIAINPRNDRLFVTSFAVTHEYKSAKEGSGLLNAEFGKCVSVVRQSIAVDGIRGIVYIAGNLGGVSGAVYAVDKTGKTCQPRFENSGPSSGKFGFNPFVAVDQASGHVIEYDETHGPREYDAAGVFVAEFGAFTEELSRDLRVAVDNSCALHEPPLDETTSPTCKEFDSANGNVYLAYDDSSKLKPPFDVNAFGPLEYPAPAKHKLTVVKEGSGS